MFKRKALLAYSILCLVLLAAVFVGVNAQRAQAADQWVNNADVSWIDPSTKLVAITFDDGPVGTAPTASSQRILDLMEKYHMHCTYFYWGEKINNSNIAELERANSLGCELGNHSFTHPYLTNMSAAQIQQEIQKTNDLLYPISGNEVTLIRPPYGSVNTTVSNSAGAPLINWSLDSADWNNGNYNSVVSNIRNRVQDGDIILCHQTYDFTAQAMETLIPELIEKGYTIVSVSELMKMKGVTLNAGTTYTNQAVGKKNITTNGFENIAITQEMINNLGTITLESGEEIAAARSAYDALTAAQKVRITNLEILEQAEKSYTKLVQSWKKVKQVIDLIDAIGEVTLDREEAIADAREAYDILLSAQKAQVTNYNVLTDAEATLAMLKMPLPFTDVSGWYESAVRYAYVNNLMNGVSEDRFDPKGSVTRAQLVAILYRAAGEPEVAYKGTFTDVKQTRWYANAVEWAAANGIVKGESNNRFNPNGVISRQDIVTILYRFENEPTVQGDLSAFADADQVSGYARSALIWAVQQGVIEGNVAEGQLLVAPRKNATRAQIAAIMMRYLQMEREQQLVTDAYTFEKAYTDDCKNTYPVSFHIPQINLSGEDFQKLNLEIYNFFYLKYVESTMEEMAAGTSLVDYGIHYQWAVGHDILSVRVNTDNSYGCDEYYTYNVNVNTGKCLSNEELAEIFGIDAEEYSSLVGAAMQSYFMDAFGNAGNTQDSFFQEQLANTISQENIDNAELYINEKGELCLVARIYSLAGADWYWHDLNALR